MGKERTLKSGVLFFFISFISELRNFPVIMDVIHEVIKDVDDMSIYDETQTRQELIVWMYSNKKVKQLQRYGFVYYVSRKMKYAVVYIDVDDAERTIKTLEKLHFVREVELSPRQNMVTDYAEAFDEYAAQIVKNKETTHLDQ